MPDEKVTAGDEPVAADTPPALGVGEIELKPAPVDYDGRFGEQFDDEVVTRPIWQTMIAVLVTMAVSGVLMYILLVALLEVSPATEPTVSPVSEANEVRAPAGPLLQADPEGELEAMREELHQHMTSYGWVDQNAGTVHIPIDDALDLLLARKSVEMGAAVADAADVAPADAAAADAAPAPAAAEGTATANDDATAGR
ncbi:MAG: hypothetical protein AAF772_09300 [Acidobacteriota bacterium]